MKEKQYEQILPLFLYFEQKEQHIKVLVYFTFLHLHLFVIA